MLAGIDLAVSRLVTQEEDGCADVPVRPLGPARRRVVPGARGGGAPRRHRLATGPDQGVVALTVERAGEVGVGARPCAGLGKDALMDGIGFAPLGLIAP